MIRLCWLVGLVLLLTPIGPRPVRADAIVRTQAMFATSIVEYQIDERGVHVELEIGAPDLPAFASLMPDEVYQELGNAPRPWPERLAEFFDRELSILGPQGAPLPGRLVEIAPRPRVRRDDVTGEPLAPGEEPTETVIFARLEYAFEGRPDTLTFIGLQSQAAASLGFVVYHEGVAVNDFRYLGRSQKLNLDWDDPWFTRFEIRNLQRANLASMSGFIYVEPYEVRKEIVIRPRSLQGFVDLGLSDRQTIPIEIQPELLRRAGEFLSAHHPILIDGKSVEGALARVNFLERTLRTSRVIDPPEELSVDSAIIGAIFVYPTKGLPQNVTMEWDLWDGRTTRIPASTVDQAGPLPVFLDPDYRMLEWQNFLKNPELPTLRAVSAPPTLAQRGLAWAWIPLFGLAIASGIRWRRTRSGLAAVATLALLVAGAAGVGLGRSAVLSEERMEAVVTNLLHNVYRAFDHRDEEAIYDVLARSVDGDLLERTFLETRRGLELANQGGARAKVKQVELIELTGEPAGEGFRASATWIVRGSVGHWGHIHQRQNRYRARLQVSPIDGAWKLTETEILEEERIDPSAATGA